MMYGTCYHCGNVDILVVDDNDEPMESPSLVRGSTGSEDRVRLMAKPLICSGCKGLSDALADLCDDILAENYK